MVNPPRLAHLTATAVPVVLVALILAALPACNTLEGAGKDLQSAGKHIQQLGNGQASVGDKDPNPYSR